MSQSRRKEAQDTFFEIIGSEASEKIKVVTCDNTAAMPRVSGNTVWNQQAGSITNLLDPCASALAKSINFSKGTF